MKDKAYLAQAIKFFISLHFATLYVFSLIIIKKSNLPKTEFQGFLDFGIVSSDVFRVSSWKSFSSTTTF